MDVGWDGAWLPVRQEEGGGGRGRGRVQRWCVIQISKWVANEGRSMSSYRPTRFAGY